MALLLKREKLFLDKTKKSYCRRGPIPANLNVIAPDLQIYAVVSPVAKSA